jgi:hypothetical protein
MDAQRLGAVSGAGRVQIKAVPDDIRAQIDAAMMEGKVTRSPPAYAEGSVHTSFGELVQGYRTLRQSR